MRCFGAGLSAAIYTSCSLQSLHVRVRHHNAFYPTHGTQVVLLNTTPQHVVRQPIPLVLRSGRQREGDVHTPMHCLCLTAPEPHITLNYAHTTQLSTTATCCRATHTFQSKHAHQRCRCDDKAAMPPGLETGAEWCVVRDSGRGAHLRKRDGAGVTLGRLTARPLTSGARPRTVVVCVGA